MQTGTARATGALPGLLIIGAQKAGTTSMLRYLVEHPAITASWLKEVHFFDDHFDKGESWYRTQFGAPERGRLFLEASPYYLFHPLAPRRAVSVVPEAKLLVMLREPVARAFSHYRHEVSKGREPLSFEDAIASEATRLADSDGQLARGEVAISFHHRHFSYVRRGLYADQISRWLDHFPKSSVLFVKAEDMFAAPQQAADRVWSFLGFSSVTLPQPKQWHQRGGEGISDSSRERLANLYAEPNARLERMTGISWRPA